MPQSLLIADDSIPLHTLLKTQLEPDAVTCHSVYDGESTIAKAAALQPDLILLDVDMPRMDGFEVCRRLKANPLTGEIPVIFLTADSLMADSVKGLECGAIDYIAKPFRPDDLKARVRSALRATKAAGATRMIDIPSGLWNRTYFDLRMKSQLAWAHRSGQTLSCIALHVERPDPIEEKLREPAKYDIFVKIAHVLQEKCRTEDVACRLDEGKFAMLLGGTDRRGAAHMAERILREIEKQFQADGPGGAIGNCSFGVADTLNSIGASLFTRADAAAYQSKQLGRNCVSIAPESAAMSDA